MGIARQRAGFKIRAREFSCKFLKEKKERKQTTQGRDGRTARRHHTGILRRVECDALAVAHPGSLPLRISFRSLSPLLAATFMPPRGRPTLVVLSLVISSSVASFSSASSCAAAACRSLVLSASFAFRRSSALLAAYPAATSTLPRCPILTRPTMSLSRAWLGYVQSHTRGLGYSSHGSLSRRGAGPILSFGSQSFSTRRV